MAADVQPSQTAPMRLLAQRRNVLLVALIPAALAACEGSQPVRGAMQVQYARVGDKDKANSALGVSLHKLGSDENKVGWFVDARFANEGSANGVEYPSAPINASAHPITDIATFAASAHVGPTFRATDGLWFHAGLGLGYMQSATERFDGSFTLSPNGYYHYADDPTMQGSATAGAMWMPVDGMVIGVGYDLFFEGTVFGIGFTF